MARAKIVVGANFGDEGKGRVVDYLAHTTSKPIVVRHNGGAQAGHTVIVDNYRHVFSHIGAGTLRGAPTFLSRFFVVNPGNFLNESNRLHAEWNPPSGLPPVFVDQRAILTTPYDVLFNQFLEQTRGNHRHGSCGIGINEAVTRSQTQFATHVSDLNDLVALDSKIDAIYMSYLYQRTQQLGFDFTDFSLWLAKKQISHKHLKINYLLQCHDFSRITSIQPQSIIDKYDTIIFEGAQGLLLDEDHYWFPHVTRSKTGSTNAVTILDELGICAAEVYYVTRPYLTRHGAGPLPFECEKPFPEIVDNTNITNEYQGSLRFAPINLDLLGETILSDIIKNEGRGVTLTPRLFVTCADQLQTVYDEWGTADCPYVQDKQLKHCYKGDMLEIMSRVYKFDVVNVSLAPCVDSLGLNVTSL
jgi:adenylosuccinate synthase